MSSITCLICGEWLHLHEWPVRAFNGDCTPWGVIIAWPADKAPGNVDHIPQVYEVAGSWLDKPLQAPTRRGYAIVSAGEADLPICDHVVRMAYAATRTLNSPSEPVRDYDAARIRFYAEKWARALGAEVVYLDDLRQEVTL